MERFATTNPHAWLLIAPFWSEVVSKARLTDDDVLYYLWEVFKGHGDYKLIIFQEEQEVKGFAIVYYNGWMVRIEFLGMHPSLTIEERKELEGQLWEECNMADTVLFSSRRPERAWARRINVQKIEGVYQWLGNEM